jgi:hypothetical protein
VLIELLFQENKSFGASTICIHPLMYVKPCGEQLETVGAAQELLGALTICGGSAWPVGGDGGSQRSQISLPSHLECTKTKPKWPVPALIDLKIAINAVFLLNST